MRRSILRTSAIPRSRRQRWVALRSTYPTKESTKSRSQRSFFGLVLVLTVAVFGSSPERIAPRFSPGPYYVGQAISMEVPLLDDRERPRAAAPVIAGADVLPAPSSPTSDTAAGSVRFLIVPRRSGALRVPAVRLTLGSGTRWSAPVTLRISPVPTAGRPREFLGGVGDFRLEAAVSRATLRAGEPCEYRIRVSGPAAIGMTNRPEVGRLGRVSIGLQVRPLPDEVVADPPVRVFRWRLRPTRSGRSTLPPVVVAGFDPRTGHYFSKATGGLPVVVTDVPRLDPNRFDEPTRRSLPAEGAWTPGAAVRSASAVALMIAACVVIGVRRRARRDTPAHRAQRLASALARSLDSAAAPSEVARRIGEGLAEYFRLAVGRPPGALTPTEAQRATQQVTGSADLAERAGRLIVLCDRARYAALGPPSQQLVEDARRVLEELAKLGVGKGRIGGTGEAEEPREAA